MLQKNLYLTRNIRFILFLQDVKFFKDMSDVRGTKFGQCRTKGGRGSKNQCFCRTLFVDGPLLVKLQTITKEIYYYPVIKEWEDKSHDIFIFVLVF